MQKPSAFNVLKTLHISLLIGMAMFYIVSIVIVQQGMVNAAGESFQRIFQLVCVGVSGALIIGGFKIFKKKIFAARNDPGDAVQKIFEPYFTSKSKGAGLGLTNTQNIILNHKGNISVKSKPGQGTSFFIALNVNQQQ